MKNTIRLKESELKQLIYESVRRILSENADDLNQYIPKKAFKMVEKVNNELRQLKEMTGEEYPELLDTSSGTEVFFKIIGDVRIEDGCLKWTEESNEYWKKDRTSQESWKLVMYDEEEGYWFDDYEFKDQMSYIRGGIKKAIKYFKEYNPEWDDDEDKRETFLGKLDESVSLYGRTMMTYDDIPKIMKGELPFMEGAYNNEKWYVLPLPNGRYYAYLCSENNKEEYAKSILSHYQDYETKTKEEMETWVKFNLYSREEAEEWLMGREICSLLDNKGYKTEMWSQLGRIGGISATKDGKTISVVGVYPSKKELMKIINDIKLS